MTVGAPTPMADPTTRAWRLADEVNAFRAATEMELALWVGRLEHIEHWDDVSEAGQAGRFARLAAYGERASALRDDRSLSSADRSLVEAVAFMLGAEQATSRWRPELMWVNPAVGLLPTLVAMLPRYVLLSAVDGDGYLAKISAMPAFVDQWCDRLRRAAAVGRLPIGRLIDGSIAQIDDLLATPLGGGPFGEQAPPRDLDDATGVRWRAELRRRLDGEVTSAFGRLRGVLAEIRPAAPGDDTPGLCHLAGGAELYERLVAANTSIEISASDVHQIGHEQVDRVEHDFREMAGPLLGTTDIGEIFERLRTDPTLHYGDSAELVADATETLARATAAAPAWFGRLPSAGCTASAIDAGAFAYYAPPARDGSRPGAFFFNTKDPTAWGRFDLQSTTFHEGIPGHHLQLALVQEIDGLHPLLADEFVVAYCEGWGLYAERLADEMGLYSTPIDRVGMLAGEAMRACRLVVDTGLHALGWSRDRAITYMLEHSPMSRHQVEAEIDRYIGDPGQALAYMIGRLEIDRIRADAEQRLGERFDIRAFHDAVLTVGSVPLTTLRRVVDEWVSGVPA